jgi:hypothetical protein
MAAQKARSAESQIKGEQQFLLTPMLPDPLHILMIRATIERPSCRKCKHPMSLARVSAGRFGHQERRYECSTCGRSEIVEIPVDPLRTDAVGWLASELKPPK